MQPLLHLKYELKKDLILKETEEAKKISKYHTDSRYPLRVFTEWKVSMYNGEYIKENFNDYEITYDQIISQGCSRRRPDILLDLGYQTIIIEVDENQHIDYDTTCEKKRINEIYSDLGDRPIVFIRFNPDDYTIKNEKNLSCWGINKIGIYINF